MAELDRAGMTLGLNRFGRWDFMVVRRGECDVHPDIADAIRDRWADAVAWVEGRYDGPDGDQVCPLCSACVTPLGRKEGMIQGLCDRPTVKSEFDESAVLCPYRRR
jgi:hypothetical protein